MQPVSRLHAYYVQAVGIAMVIASSWFIAYNLSHAAQTSKLRSHITTIMIGTGILSVLFIYLSLFLLLWGHRLICFRVARQAALQRNGVEPLLVLPLPQALPSGVTLPLKVSLKPAFWRTIVLVVFAMASAIIFTSCCGLTLGDTVQDVLPAGLFFGAFLSIPFVVWFFSAFRQQIEVTENGLNVVGGIRGSSRKPQTIRWEEAMLFAVIPPTYGGRTMKPTYYELAGVNKRVCWIQTYRSMPFFPLMLLFETSMRPELSFDEYEQTMEMIIAIIADKTKLPLYDLR